MNPLRQLARYVWWWLRMPVRVNQALDNTRAMMTGLMPARERNVREEGAPAEPSHGSVPTPFRQTVYLGDHVGLTRTAFGHKLFVDTRDMSLAPHIIVDGYWELWITDVFRRLVEPGMNVVEVGSNVGYYTLLACDGVGRDGRVWAFEANPRLAELLHRTIEVNGYLARTTIVNAAVTERSGEITFHARRHRMGDSSLFPTYEKELKEARDEQEAFTVPCVTLDGALGPETRVDLVKIDAEGAEPLVLEGMSGILKRNPALQVICEFGPSQFTRSGRNPGEWLDSLLEAGFRIQMLSEDRGLRPTNRDELLATTICDIHLSRP